MRLTLRTLLAYLDDALEPAQAKEIGQKIAESEAAQQLVQRIQAALREQRLAVPPATGPSARLDANTIAEYLDETLPAEKLAEVEELCQGSDVYLAEVAACHQIMTLMEGEPARVPAPARQRMYGLIKGKGLPRRKPPAAPPAPPPAAPEREEADEALLLGLPPFLRRGGWVGWLAPLAGVVGLCLILGLVIYKALPQTGSRQVARSDPPSDAKQPDQAPQPAPPDAKPSEKVEVPPDPVPDKPVPPVKPAPKPVEKPPDRKVVGKLPENAPSAERRVLGKYAPGAGASVLVQRTGEDKWQRLRALAAVSSAELLVSLPGCKSELRLDSGIRLTLWGSLPQFAYSPTLSPELPVVESALVLHVPAADFDLDFTLDRGRVVLANQKKSDAKMRVRFHKEVWELSLDPQAECSLELWGRYPRDVPFSPVPGGEEPMTILFLVGLKGDGSVKTDFRTFALRSPTRLTWDNMGSGVQGSQPLPEPPRWYAKPLPQTAPVQQMIAALDELNTQLNKKDAQLELVLAETRLSNRTATRTLGVMCLGATDAYSALIDALGDEKADVREEAVNTLRHWSALRPENDLLLFKMLQEKKGYARGHATIFMQLLHSFSENDTTRPETYETLLAYLKHDKIAIRELAWWHLARLVPDVAKRMPFNAAADGEQRDRAFEMWKQLIPDGKLPPRPMGTPKG